MSCAAPSSSPPPLPPQVWNVPTDPIGPGPLGRRGPSLFRITSDFFFPLPILFSPLRRPISHAHVRVHIHVNAVHIRTGRRERFCARRRRSRFSAAKQGRRRALVAQSYAVAARVYSCAVLVVVPVCT